MTTKIAINGYGRIGRCFHRILLGGGHDFELVAINDLTDAATLAHLLKYDSVHGALRTMDIRADGDKLLVEGRAIPVMSVRDPAELPWKDLGVELVLESSGVFRTEDAAGKHLKAGAKKVILSAPAKGGEVATFVMGVNHDSYDPAKHNIVSNASCFKFSRSMRTCAYWASDSSYTGAMLVPGIISWNWLRHTMRQASRSSMSG